MLYPRKVGLKTVKSVFFLSKTNLAENHNMKISLAETQKGVESFTLKSS